MKGSVQFLLLVFLGHLQDIDAGFSWLTTLAENRQTRHVRNAPSGLSGCLGVQTCYRRAIGNFREIMGRFELGEIYDSSESWCRSTPNILACWSNECHNGFLEVEMTIYDRILTRICETRTGFREASGCFQDYLSTRLMSCIERAEMRNQSPLQCTLNVFDSLPAPCREEDKIFLRNFFEFIYATHEQVMSARG